jgi:hypothetical protein
VKRDRWLTRGPARPLAAFALAVLAIGAWSGCGGGSSTPTETTGALQREAERAEAQAPKGASQALRAIYRQFPKPQPDGTVKGSAKAVKAGERACKGKTPLEVREEFIGESKLLEEQAKMVAELPKFERALARSSSFVAGQLGALVYERTLDPRIAHFGYEGCVYSLAKAAERKLAPQG